MIKIKLRKKLITGNRETLYLDFYPSIINDKGKTTRREFLNMYVYSEIQHLEEFFINKNGNREKRIIPIINKNGKPKKIKLTNLEELHNKETLELANQIMRKRENIINKPEIYSEFEKEQIKNKEQGKKSFIEYFKQLRDKRIGTNYDNWNSAISYLEKFSDNNLKFSELTEKFCNEFKEYLLSAPGKRGNATAIKQNTAQSYFNKFKAALRQAYKDDKIKINLNAKIEPIKYEDTHRQFLTLEELEKLAKTECDIPELKRAALFSALTGLRFSDINKMIWKEIQHNQNGYFIDFRQQKT